MRKQITAVAAAAAMTFALAGPAAAEKPGWAGPDNGMTIVGTAVTLSGGLDDEGNAVLDDNPDDFDILVTAVLATPAIGILDGSSDYTVFAPTDRAFIDIADALSDDDITTESAAVGVLIDVLGVDGIFSVLAYHVTDGWRPSPSVLNAKKITMLDGNTITAREGFVDGIGSDANFLQTDVKTTDGGIHVIDTVLLPF